MRWSRAIFRNWTELPPGARLFVGASALSFLGDGMRYAALPLLAAKHGAGTVGLDVLLGFATRHDGGRGRRRRRGAQAAGPLARYTA